MYLILMDKETHANTTLLQWFNIVNKWHKNNITTKILFSINCRLLGWNQEQIKMPTQLLQWFNIINKQHKNNITPKIFFPLIVGYKDEIENKLESIDIDIDTCTNYILWLACDKKWVPNYSSTHTTKYTWIN